MSIDPPLELTLEFLGWLNEQRNKLAWNLDQRVNVPVIQFLKVALGQRKAYNSIVDSVLFNEMLKHSKLWSSLSLLYLTCMCPHLWQGSADANEAMRVRIPQPSHSPWERWGISSQTLAHGEKSACWQRQTGRCICKLRGLKASWLLSEAKNRTSRTPSSGASRQSGAPWHLFQTSSFWGYAGIHCFKPLASVPSLGILQETDTHTCW